jgi:DNA sulfur modification protein DndB
MNDRIFLPALQARFGDWVYYAAIMPLRDVMDRIEFAHVLHKNKRLSDLIQRQLQDETSGGRKNRVGEIVDYLQSSESRFFNSIVVGTYGGDPTWHPFDVTPKQDFEDVESDLIAQERIGFLELSGSERLFALDGQHRVAGIKRAVVQDEELADELITVLFVPHSNTEAGLRRTRSLFVDLNKKAVPVGRKDIIALDEVDLAAILSRRLVDDHKWFSRGQIDVDRFGLAVPKSSPSLMSIGTLYDVIKAVLPGYAATSEAERKELETASRTRLSEDRLNHYQDRVISYFRLLGKCDDMLASYLESGAGKGIAEKARSAKESRVLFRPVGQRVFADVISTLSKSKGTKHAAKLAQLLPTRLIAAPFVHVIWDPEEEKIVSKGRSLATRVLKYMVGIPPKNIQKTRDDYADAQPDGKGNLPKQLG